MQDLVDKKCSVVQDLVNKVGRDQDCGEEGAGLWELKMEVWSGST